MENKTVKISVKCTQCGKEFEFTVYEKDLESYNNGELIQRAFPYLSPEERELMISGYCPDCWKKLWK